ncbi:MAG: hypothetical protein ACR2PL_10285 [Dehalococcoidia bacterium]
MLERIAQSTLDLDGRTFSFVVETREPIRRGETVIVREVVQVGGRLEIHAVTESALREEANKLFVN